MKLFSRSNPKRRTWILVLAECHGRPHWILLLGRERERERENRKEADSGDPRAHDSSRSTSRTHLNLGEAPSLTEDVVG